MADINFRCNVRGSDFPLISTQFGRTVLAKSSEDYTNSTSKTYADSFRDRYSENAGYLYYHNVLPTIVGLRSVSYVEKFTDLGLSVGEKVINVDILRTCAEDRLLLASTTEGNYLSSGTGWLNVSGASANSQITMAHLHKRTVVCRSEAAVESYDEDFGILAPLALNGLDPSKVIGVAEYANYLIAHTGDTIYWSSLVDILDFMPSLVTGAGSMIPNDLRGKIVFCSSINSGILIFTTANVVYGKYTGDANFPFAFRELTDSGGITSINHVTKAGNDGIIYYWSTRGCQTIDTSTLVCDNVLPELQDFLAGGLFEDHVSDVAKFSATNVGTVWASQTQIWQADATPVAGLVQMAVSAGFKVGFRYIANRYFVVSYGVKNPEDLASAYTHALVYDNQLLRWGKGKFTHVDCIDMSDTTVSTDKTVSYEPNHNIGFMAVDGSISTINSEHNNLSSDSVVYFGKLQHNRNKMTTLMSVEVENSLQSTTNLEVLTSLDGKNTQPAMQPVKQIDSPNLQKWLMRTTGINHTLRMSGSFDIVSLTGMAVTTGAR